MHLFHYNAAARIPAHVQLEEQVKVALALGKLRPGICCRRSATSRTSSASAACSCAKPISSFRTPGWCGSSMASGAVVTGQARANGRVTEKAEALIQRDPGRAAQRGAGPGHLRAHPAPAAARGGCAGAAHPVRRFERSARARAGQQIQQALGVHVRAMRCTRLRRYRASVTERYPGARRLLLPRRRPAHPERADARHLSGVVGLRRGVHRARAQPAARLVAAAALLPEQPEGAGNAARRSMRCSTA